MSARLAVLGVRHHGPGSARAVAAALEEHDPQVVVIEGPPELDRIVAVASSPDLVPPVAALAYVPEDTRRGSDGEAGGQAAHDGGGSGLGHEPMRASFYPFAAFSPEWVALQWALGHGRTVRFADLPAANALAAGPPRRRAGGPRTDPIAALAAAAGFDDPERWWEDAVEHRGAARRAGAGAATEQPWGLATFAAVGEAMAAVRALERGADDDSVREAAMRRVLRATLKEADRVAMVCGAWHAPALDPAAWPTASGDTRMLTGLAKVKVAATWVPWTAQRLAYASGYGAGVTAPGWYGHLFASPEDPGPRWLARTAVALRGERLDTSTASVIEATRLADALAALRGRPIPGLEELLEATQAVLCEGSAVPMQLVSERLLVGRDLGRVPDDTPMVPLARDLAVQQRRLRMPAAAGPSRLELDLRKATHLGRSVLLHRLGLLGIPWGLPAAAARSTGTFREAWTLDWEPELSVAVIASSGLGTTVAAAAAAAVRRDAAEADLAALCRLADTALHADLPDALDEVLATLTRAAAVQRDTLVLLAAVEPLAQLHRYGGVRRIDTHAVAAALDGIATRAAIGLPGAALALDDEAASDLSGLLDAVHRGLATAGRPGLRDRWLDSLATVAGRDGVHGLIAGRCTRLLLDAGRLDPPEVGRRMGLALSAAADQLRAAAWLEGFLVGRAGAGTPGDALLLLYDPALLAIVDGWLRGVPDPAFDDVLPLLRRTFAPFPAPERRALGEHLTRLRGDGTAAARPDAEHADDLDPTRAALPVPLLLTVLGLDP